MTALTQSRFALLADAARRLVFDDDPPIGSARDPFGTAAGLRMAARRPAAAARLSPAPRRAVAQPKPLTAAQRTAAAQRALAGGDAQLRADAARRSREQAAEQERKRAAGQAMWGRIFDRLGWPH